MSDVYIKIKMDEKEVKLKSSTLNNSNLAMIFRLDLNQGIYISSEEGEIILPSDTGFYHVEDLEKTYFVNGERMSPNSVRSVVSAVQSTSLGLPLSYQRTAKRSNLNPPRAWTECAGHTKTTDLHYDKERSSGMEEIACCGGRAAVWRNQRKVPGAYVAHRRNFVGR